MYRVRYVKHRQNGSFLKFRSDEAAAQCAANLIASTNGPLMVRITFNGKLVYDYERP